MRAPVNDLETTQKSRKRVTFSTTPWVVEYVVEEACEEAERTSTPASSLGPPAPERSHTPEPCAKKVGRPKLNAMQKAESEARLAKRLFEAAERTLREKKRKLNEEGAFFDPPSKVARLKARLEREAGRLEELLTSWERCEGAVVDARISAVTDAKDAWKRACKAAQTTSNALKEQLTVVREKLRWSEWMLDRAIGEAADMDVERILTSRRKLREQHTHELWLKGII